jgi:Viral BACON domain
MLTAPVCRRPPNFDYGRRLSTAAPIDSSPAPVYFVGRSAIFVHLSMVQTAFGKCNLIDLHMNTVTCRVVYTNSSGSDRHGCAALCPAMMAFEPVLRITMRGIVGVVVLASLASAQASLTLEVSSETAPAGGWAQIKVFASSPTLIASGALSVDLDPTVFGNIAGVAVFSATGDAIGFANVNGRHVDAQFSSNSASIGQLPGIPVFQISAPVLDGVAAGATVPVTLKPSAPSGPSPYYPAPTWQDAKGNTYSVTVNPGQFTVGGTLSIESVSPGGGLLPAGTALQISCTGFDSGTTVSIDGVAFSGVQVVSPDQINLTLGAPTEMTGKHVRIGNATGEQVDYYSSLPSAPSNSVLPVSGLHAMVPLRTYTAVTLNNILIGHGGLVALALLNPNLEPVTVLLEGVGGLGMDTGVLQTEQTITVPPGNLYFAALDSLLQATSQLWVTASAPVRMLQYQEVSAGPYQVFPPTPSSGSLPPLTFTLPVSPASVSWQWQTETPAPQPATINVSGSFGFTATVSGSLWFTPSWLTVTPAQGTGPATLTLTPNVSGLNPGTYTATVTVTPVMPQSIPGVTAQSSQVMVSLTVSAHPFISVPPAPPCCLFIYGQSSAAPPTETLTVVSSGGPVTFTASVVPGTGGNWLSVSPTTGTTPATLTLTANPRDLAAGPYSAGLSIQGPSNTVTVGVQLFVSQPPANPPPGALTVTPSSLSFTLPSGTTPPTYFGQTLATSPLNAALSVSVQTQSGGNWLTAAVEPPPPFPIHQVFVNVDAAGARGGIPRDGYDYVSQRRFGPGARDVHCAARL